MFFGGKGKEGGLECPCEDWTRVNIGEGKGHKDFVLGSVWGQNHMNPWIRDGKSNCKCQEHGKCLISPHLDRIRGHRGKWRGGGIDVVFGYLAEIGGILVGEKLIFYFFIFIIFYKKFNVKIFKFKFLNIRGEPKLSDNK